MATIGEQIKTARKAKGLTQDDLAKAINATRQTVSNYEAGKRLPDGETLLRLSKALGYSFEAEGAKQPTAAVLEDEKADAEQTAPISSMDDVKSGSQILQSGG